MNKSSRLGLIIGTSLVLSLGVCAPAIAAPAASSASITHPGTVLIVSSDAKKIAKKKAEAKKKADAKKKAEAKKKADKKKKKGKKKADPSGRSLWDIIRDDVKGRLG